MINAASDEKSTKNILLLTGIPGVGKTTVVRKLADHLKGLHIAGFYTSEIRKNRIRQGFELITFQGRKVVMAHVDFPKIYKVGKYGVDVGAIDEAVTASLLVKKDVDVYLVDETKLAKWSACQGHSFPRCTICWVQISLWWQRLP